MKETEFNQTIDNDYLITTRVKFYFQCKKCGHSWAINLKDGKMPEGYKVCISCARKEKLHRLNKIEM